MTTPVELERVAELKVGLFGAGPYMFHRRLLEPCGFRPAADEISHYIDSSTMKGIGRFINWEYRDLHPLQYVGFRQPPLITPYERLWNRWGVTWAWTSMTGASPATPYGPRILYVSLAVHSYFVEGATFPRMSL